MILQLFICNISLTWVHYKYRQINLAFCGGETWVPRDVIAYQTLVNINTAYHSQTSRWREQGMKSTNLEIPTEIPCSTFKTVFGLYFNTRGDPCTLSLPASLPFRLYEAKSFRSFTVPLMVIGHSRLSGSLLC